MPVPKPTSPTMRVSMVQLDNFLQFITSPHMRKLQLSKGKILETPNTIRLMISQRIVDQYEEYCSETNFKPFSKSTMLRILSACTATVRKSLQGLDYIAAEGGKAFNNLLVILDKNCDYATDRSRISSCEDALKAGKQYLKTDYKVRR